MCWDAITRCMRYTTEPGTRAPYPFFLALYSLPLVVDLESSSQLSADELLERFRRYREYPGIAFSSLVLRFTLFFLCLAVYSSFHRSHTKAEASSENVTKNVSGCAAVARVAGYYREPRRRYLLVVRTALRSSKKEARIRPPNSCEIKNYYLYTVSLVCRYGCDAWLGASSRMPFRSV